MATTIGFILTNSVWTDISTTVGTSGFLFNNSDDSVVYRQSDTVPPNTLTEGHILLPKNQINYTIIAPEVIYARSVKEFALLTATAGVLS